MFVITLGAADRGKTGIDEVSGMVLSGGLFEVTWVGNHEGAGSVEGDPVGNSEVIGVGNKLGIYDSEVTDITLGVTDRRKLGGYEV